MGSDPGDVSPTRARAPVDPRRFGGVARLYGAGALQRFRRAHVCVIGVGGVGSWAVEALARNAIGRLTLIDLDHVAESNTNRQIHALGDAYGMAKVQAMAQRVLAINPECEVRGVEEFVEPDNLDALLDHGFDAIIDAIDSVRAKTALLAWSHAHRVPLVSCGGAGGRTDPTRVRIDDVARTAHDPLLARVRTGLRRDHGFPKGPKAKFGIVAVYSDEILRRPQVGETCALDGGAGEVGDSEAGTVTGEVPSQAPQGLNCAGFGSSVCVTAMFGFAAAAHVLSQLAADATPASPSAAG